MEVFVLEVLRPLAVPGREAEQPEPVAGQGVRGDWQLRAAALSLCANMSHHLHLLSSSKGFVVFLLLQEGSSRRQRTKTAGLWGPALREEERHASVGSERVCPFTPAEP